MLAQQVKRCRGLGQGIKADGRRSGQRSLWWWIGRSAGEPGVSGDFWGSQEGCQGPSRPSGRNRGLPLRRRGGQGWDRRVRPRLV